MNLLWFPVHVIIKCPWLYMYCKFFPQCGAARNGYCSNLEVGTTFSQPPLCVAPSNLEHTIHLFLTPLLHVPSLVPRPCFFIVAGAKTCFSPPHLLKKKHGLGTRLTCTSHSTTQVLSGQACVTTGYQTPFSQLAISTPLPAPCMQNILR